MENSRFFVRLTVICLAAGTLAACAQPKSLYNWQSYQPQVYAYLKNEDTDYAAQVASLENNVQTARSANQALPPGFYAHLGMLYLKLGQGDKAVEQMQSEKLAFPESTAFMDFLLRNVSDKAEAPADPNAAKTGLSVDTSADGKQPGSGKTGEM